MTDPKVLAASLLPDGTVVENVKQLQSLWAGFGYIYSLSARLPRQEAKAERLILKVVAPPVKADDDETEEGDLRKLYSYEVEEYFYTVLVPQMRDAPARIATAECKGSSRSARTGAGGDGHSRAEQAIALALTDLRVQFPRTPSRRGQLDETQSYAALRWLARFHSFWMHDRNETTRDMVQSGSVCLPPLQECTRRLSDPSVAQRASVWLNGGYTYLATRQKEYAALSRSKRWARLRSERIGERVADQLSPSAAENRPYLTLLHGDVKSENLFTSEDGKEVAFFDFQYVGLGLGVCDLAKLFTCSISPELLQVRSDGSAAANRGMCAGEEALLRYYHEQLGAQHYSWEQLVAHWELALVDWLRFQAGWGFWGNTQWLESRVDGILLNWKS